MKCVIAKSFAFIYSRNQPSLGLVGVVIDHPDFYSMAADGTEIQIDTMKNTVTVGDSIFPFRLSPMEKSLVKLGGITPAFMKFGKEIFSTLCRAGTTANTSFDVNAASGNDSMQW